MLAQDNDSAIVIHKYYPYSTRKGTKHIYVRYFFVVDKIRNKEVKVTHCPTEKMQADFSSKPTQGLLFKKQRNVAMGLKDEDFPMHKAWHKRIIEKHDLWDNQEEDLDRI